MINGGNLFFESFQAGFEPKQILTVSQWADKFRMLTSKTASEPGPYRTDRTPYIREIADCLSHMNPAKKVVWQKSAQIGATELGLNWLGYIIDYDPATTMIVWPALPDVKKNSKLRIDPLLKSTPVLSDKVSAGKNKDQKNTALFKDFDGGALILTGANSASGLCSVPAKYLFLDEVDRFPDDVENEGDPIALVMARSRTYSRRKAFLCSTPTVKGRSKIAKEFNASDQRYFYVPCPHCKKRQILNWKNIQYNTNQDDNGEEVVTECSYFCEHCGEEIPEHHKTKMLIKGKWIKHNPKSEIPGFHINALYSPLGWYSWKEIAQDWVNAQGDQTKLQAFVNTVLGETFEVKGEKPAHDQLYSRRELYNIGTVPRGVVFLTCSVDVQDDRLEALVQGWGRGRECWDIEHKVITGKPTEQETWDDLGLYISSTFSHVDGFDMGIRMVGVDSGFQTSHVYNFCEKYSSRQVIPIKGQPSLSTMVGTPKAVSVKLENGKRIKKGVKLWGVSTDMIKSELYGDLQKDPPEDLIEDYPKGFIHFPQFDQDFFLQLTAEERRITKNKKGFAVIEWIKVRERNEILDLHVYGRALSHIIGIDRLNESQWQKLEGQIKVAPKLHSKENGKQDKKTKRKKRSPQSDYW